MYTVYVMKTRRRIPVKVRDRSHSRAAHDVKRLVGREGFEPSTSRSRVPLGINKNNDFRVQPWTKQEKTGQIDPISETATQPDKGGDTIFFPDE
jgi:hypothetical protein